MWAWVSSTSEMDAGGTGKSSQFFRRHSFSVSYTHLDVYKRQEFTDVDALRAYASHPLHQRAGAFIATVKTGRWACDYEL